MEMQFALSYASNVAYSDSQMMSVGEREYWFSLLEKYKKAERPDPVVDASFKNRNTENLVKTPNLPNRRGNQN